MYGIVPAAEPLKDAGYSCDDDRGVPAFDKLRDSVSKGFVTSAVMICWDLLWEGEEDLRVGRTR